MLAALKLKAQSTRMADASKVSLRHRRQQQAAAVLEVGDESLLDKIAFHAQGDAELNSVEALNTRQKLKRNPRIARELERWWAAALGTAHLSRADADSLIFDDWKAVYKPVYKAMTSDEYDEVRRLMVDLDPSARMTLPAFHASLAALVLLPTLFC